MARTNNAMEGNHARMQANNLIINFFLFPSIPMESNIIN